MAAETGAASLSDWSGPPPRPCGGDAYIDRVLRPLIVRQRVRQQRQAAGFGRESDVKTRKTRANEKIMTPRRAASSSAPIRLTRRGRIVVTCLVVALCAGLLLLVTSTRSDPQPVPSFDAPLGALDESKVPNGWGPLVAAASRESGVPGAVLAAQLEVESKWNPKAVSHANAKGLAQFTPDAWASHGKGDPFDPADAIAAQGRLMRELKQRAERSGIADNPMRLALAGYNAGFGNVTKYQGVPPFAETEHYVGAIAHAMGKYAKPLPPTSGASMGGAARSGATRPAS